MADRFLEAPPPRRRVIERDGRLVVIDSGAPAAVPVARKIGGRHFRRTAFDGRGILTTRRWYDDKGPRRLAVDPTTGRVARLVPVVAVVVIMALIGLVVAYPVALAGVALLAQPKPWKRLRARITRYLDAFPAAV